MSVYYTQLEENVYLFKNNTNILKVGTNDIEIHDSLSSKYSNSFNNAGNLFPIHQCIGILGMIEFSLVKYLIVIKSVNLESQLFGNYFYSVSECDFLPIKLESDLILSKQNHDATIEELESDDEEYLKLVKYNIKRSKLIFCLSLDLFNNFQNVINDGKNGLSDLKLRLLKNLTSNNPESLSSEIIGNLDSENEFFWNRFLLESFFGTRKDIYDFLVPVINGVVSFSKVDDVRIGVISRRSKYRAGTRYFKRGLDKDGNVANYNETEQILLTKTANNGGGHGVSNGSIVNLHSYVQVRGSIPLNWAEVNNLKYKPKLSISKKIDIQATEKHFSKILHQYEKVYIVNLINNKGHELPIKYAYEATINQLKDSYIDPAQLEYVYFDFHTECKNMKFEKVQLLLNMLEAKDLSDQDFLKIQFFDNDVKNYDILSTQHSVVRTNCMDCLDRTNVVQSVLGKWILNRQLEILKIESNAGTNQRFSDTYGDLESNIDILLQRHKALGEFDGAMNEIWTINGDTISKMYSGTGALKSDYTRTGKRSFLGMGKDLVNSILRYFLNNFKDGSRQDSIDLFLGNFKPSIVNTGINFRTLAVSETEKIHFNPYNSTGLQSSQIFPSTANFGNSPFRDSRTFRFVYMPYLLFSTSALFVSVLLFPKGGSVFTTSNMVLLGTCFFVLSYSLYFIFENGLQFVSWPRLCQVEFLRKQKIEDMDEIEGFEYIQAEEFGASAKFE